jgi:hypothetical protein
MLAWALTPSVVAWPAASTQRLPVWVATRPVHDPDLANVATRVVREEHGERLLGRSASPQQVEPVRAVGHLGEGLRDDGPDSRFDPWAARPDERPTGLDGDAEATAVRVAGDDRVRHRVASSWPHGACRPRDIAQRWPVPGVFPPSTYVIGRNTRLAAADAVAVDA